MEGTIMYIAIDGNSTGKKIEKMIFDNDVNSTQQGKDVSSTNNAGKLDQNM